MVNGEDILKSIKNGEDFGKSLDDLEEEFDVDRREIGRFLSDREDVVRVSNKFFKYLEK